MGLMEPITEKQNKIKYPERKTTIPNEWKILLRLFHDNHPV